MICYICARDANRGRQRQWNCGNLSVFTTLLGYEASLKRPALLNSDRPTVTTHLRQLEDEFAITLFDRIKRPIQLTSEGSILFELVTPVVQAVDTLKTQAGLQRAPRFIRCRSPTRTW